MVPHRLGALRFGSFFVENPRNLRPQAVLFYLGIAGSGFKRSHKRSRYRLGQLSDGQRALIALYCLLRFCDGRAAKASLFVDEPDNYISLREVQPWVVALSEALGDTLEQAVIISHHPVTIDYLGGKAKWSSGTTTDWRV